MGWTDDYSDYLWDTRRERGDDAWQDHEADVNDYRGQDDCKGELQYKDEVAQDLLQAADEYLTFATWKDMLRLLVEGLQ